MLDSLRSRLTYANVTATLALFIALGGSSYAFTIPRDSVGARQIRTNAVRSSEVAARAIGSSELRNNSIKGQDVDESTLGVVPRAGSANAAAIADQAAVALDASKLGGAEASSFRVGCPGAAPATQAYAGICMETAIRGSLDYNGATQVCEDAGRRLPTAAELNGFRRVPGVTLSAGEMAADLFDDADAAAPAAMRYVVLSDGAVDGGNDLTTVAPYRCAAERTN